MAEIILQDFNPETLEYIGYSPQGSEIDHYLATKTETVGNPHLVVGASFDISLLLHNDIILHCS